MPQFRTGGMLFRAKADLHRLIAIRRNRLDLGNRARTGLNHRHRNSRTLGAKHLGHPHLLTQQPTQHNFLTSAAPDTRRQRSVTSPKLLQAVVSLIMASTSEGRITLGIPARSSQQIRDLCKPSPHLASSSWLCTYNLISISTPEGRFSRVSASTVFGVGSTISIRRLCVRISNCSRESLSIKGERSTVYFTISVGSGTGPATRAPVFWAVSTICAADWSRMRWSKAFSRIRIRCLVVVANSFS